MLDTEGDTNHTCCGLQWVSVEPKWVTLDPIDESSWECGARCLSADES